MWVIPPEQSGEFVAHMEDVLDVYQRPDDPRSPMVCMDEQPVQLIQEVRPPLPAAEGKPARYDDEYERNGTANSFMCTEPLRGKRGAMRPQKAWTGSSQPMMPESNSSASTHKCKVDRALA
jgi:hypothetical protein